MSSSDAYKQGLAAFRAKKYKKALRFLEDLSDPNAIHLAAVSAQKLGEDAHAESLYNRVAKVSPTDANIANNYGHFLLAAGRLSEARERFQQALKYAAGLPAALIGLAKIETRLENWENAKTIYRHVLQLSPNSRVAAYGLGTALLETGEADTAKSFFSKLVETTETPEAMFMLGRTYLELDAIDDAQTSFQRSYQINPTEHTLRNLANVTWMKGETARFHQLIDSAPSSLSSTAVELAVECGELERARHAWNRRFMPGSIDKSAWLTRAIIARAEQNEQDLSHSIDKALEYDSNDVYALDLRIVADLMLGNPELALTRIAPLRSKYPNSQHWIAHEFVASRMLNRESPLLDVDSFVRAYDIELPPQYESIERFNNDLADALKACHKFKARPLNQSLRGHGTQTTRSLTEQKHPVINSYIRSLEAPIRQYLADIGQDPHHPTSARNNGAYRISGMWSVWLRGKGCHESHVHPHGWISSAYYVSVPDETNTSPSRQGWIGFGAPPYRTLGASEPLKWLQPRPGRVVLFPSFMWHGTNPISTDAERLTAPFDLVPN